ncbi:hypothetical protein MSG28_005074 [Choristoneura fumiferana]|uniref:Uncharacterized protein n=1 Tax=Choristoneura fumiferana TaxID=7141 RepID=A0ACC0JPZ9_CHOFU|nr:hypothetical protein MSG28_005074 [Choristoneura fumiferana]
MAGVLFIVNIPRKEHEEDLKKAKSSKLVVEKEKYEKASKLIRELKTNKRFGNIKSSFESFRGERGLSKCKSSECVHESGDFGLLKSKSDNVLNESYKLGLSVERQLKDKSWDIKQMMKRRKKLRITQPASMTDISGAFHRDTPLESILSEVITRLNIVNNATWTTTEENKHWQVLFSLDSCYECEELLQVLRNLGIGSRYNSSISVIPCTLYFRASNDEIEHYENDTEGLQSEEDSAWARFSSTVRARANLAQVLHDVRTDAALTFDWLFLLIVAAFVAAIGLVENSTVILVASMLISPLMGPITAGTLGTAVRDRSLQQLGVLHELLGLFLALVIGFIFGLAVCAVDGRYGIGEWPTYEMMTRCEIRSLWVGVLVAIPSGAGVALSVLGRTPPLWWESPSQRRCCRLLSMLDFILASLKRLKTTPSGQKSECRNICWCLAGTWSLKELDIAGIDYELTTPFSGLLWAMAIVQLIFADDQAHFTGVVTTSYYSSDQPTELAVLGTVSLCLTLVNIACIFVAGVAVYKNISNNVLSSCLPFGLPKIYFSLFQFLPLSSIITPSLALQSFYGTLSLDVRKAKSLPIFKNLVKAHFLTLPS